MLVVLRVFGLLVRDNRCWRWLFHRVPVRGPLICRGGAWAGRLRRRYPPCQAAGAPLARQRLRYRRCYRLRYRRCYRRRQWLRYRRCYEW